MALPKPEDLRSMIEPLAAAHGMDVENVATVPAGKKSQVVVALDSDERPGLEELEAVSNELGALFDAKEDAGELNFGAGYTLEVTTPGVGLPLTRPRHWRRNRGRRVTIEGEAYRIGALDGAEDNVVLIEVGGKTPRVHVRPVSALAGAVVEVEFTTPPAAEVELAQLTFDTASEDAAN
ncbi:ribosome maturation factor RimP [Corynebacterium liangguodongii]|uniref:Ribosome maturation factor RimP n=1 Tax=Corynebacterium liangguodongii TaxID=2079535 RepID=A0A2S0WEL5_9CORY|nr:ribosome maturation factor RimP [Corynebacterium liangguodongii]AWB84227.1 ribosome maturation factor RimP [Corynebacterium liangguodongii]PWC00236.1 ribosome maturation factor RimP [Corynebacterium liangguodongii]